LATDGDAPVNEDMVRRPEDAVGCNEAILTNRNFPFGCVDRAIPSNCRPVADSQLSIGRIQSAKPMQLDLVAQSNIISTAYRNASVNREIASTPKKYPAVKRTSYSTQHTSDYTIIRDRVACLIELFPYWHFRPIA